VRGKRPGDHDAPLTVEALVRAASLLVETQIGLVWVTGEISNLRSPGSGHIYFVLKDGAAVPAILWRSTAQKLRFRLEEGKHYLVRGRLGIFPEQGKLQLYVEAIEPVGLGAAAAALEQLKQKLAAEGLFAQERKRRLPRLPRRIGVVTSPTGAAVRDIIRVIERRFPVPILISPARVQGEGAGVEIARAIRRLCRFADVDVVIVGRGGGSSEDLSAFNEEAVVRAIAACHVPIISAVGHEVDVTLADLAADVRAATPTAAGEMAVPEWKVLDEGLRKLEARLGREASFLIEGMRRGLERLEARLGDPRRRLDRDRQRVDELMARATSALRTQLGERRRQLAQLEVRRATAHPRARLRDATNRLGGLEQRAEQAMAQILAARRRQLENAGASLDAMSPLRVLERGYAVARTPEGHVVSDAASVAEGDELDVRLARGRLDVRILRKHPGEDPA
jgi:exodeoxyribonuclease VII large subunit